MFQLSQESRPHRHANCSRRKQPTEVENGNQCTFFHHPLLHKTKTANIGVASLSDHKDSVLPVISANICEAKGLYKTGNILFDSRAQISLIRLETVDNLQLSGRDVAGNIVKVGGEEKEIQTKLYRVSLSGIGDTKKYVVKAISIPCISE